MASTVRARAKRRQRRLDETMEHERRQRLDCELTLIADSYKELEGGWIAYVLFSYKGEPMEVGGSMIPREGIRWAVFSNNGPQSAGDIQ